MTAGNVQASKCIMEKCGNASLHYCNPTLYIKVEFYYYIYTCMWVRLRTLHVNSDGFVSSLLFNCCSC